MATLLRAIGIPEVGDRLVERFECLKFYTEFFLIVLAHIDEIVGELLVILRLQIVLAPIRIPAHAATIGHIVRT